MSTQAGKEVVYVDIDDEITAIIDKVRGSGEKIVALVLPKRATVLQSIVNMKLLKRTADEAKKHLVLITSEAGLMPLAGSVGLYVAKSLQSKPEIPHLAAAHLTDANEDEETVNMADAAALDPAKSIGEHARSVPPSAITPDEDDDEEPIELDNTSTSATAPSALAKSSKKDKPKFRIPDFGKFKMWVIIGVAALLILITGWYFGFVVLPSANVTIKTDSTALAANLDVTLNTSVQEVNSDADVIPATAQQTQKTTSQQVPATGQKDNGTKASGSVMLTNCSQDGSPRTVPAGSGLSANGLTFITQSSVTLATSAFDSHGNCKAITGISSRGVNVVAQDNGDKYNIGPTNFTIAGASDMTATSSSAMSGGTSNIVQVVSQADIDGAKQKLTAQDTSAIKQELQQKLTGQNLFVIDASFSAGNPEITTSANVGDQAGTVTVTQKTTYTMLGVKQDDLKTLIANAVKNKIDSSKQKIIDYGLSSATFKLENQQGNATTVAMGDTAIAGSAIDLNAVKKQIAGKKTGDVKQIIGAYPGVTDVTVHYSPFWVSSVPGDANKITVTVEKPVLKQ